MGRSEPLSAIVLVTGLPSAGKTTLGTTIVTRLRHDGFPAEHLDGDVLRQTAPVRLGFDRDSRQRQAERAGRLSVAGALDGKVVVLSLIAPYADDRARIRQAAETAGIRFLEVHLDTPLEECRRRDGKGLYAAAARGRVTELTGVDAPYEPPVSPDFRLAGPDAPTERQAAEILQAIADPR